MSIDISSDYLLADNTESVTFTSDPNGTPSAVTVANASRRQVNRQELQFGGVGISADDIIWVLPASQLGSLEPRPNDTITDAASNVYRIGNSIHKRQLGNSTTHWRVATVKDR